VALRTLLVALLVGAAGASPGTAAAPASGPLRVLASNPRYFADAAGRPVYLTGSHVWWNLVGAKTWKVDCRRGAVRRFSYDAYLRRLRALNHNFFRLWTSQQPAFVECGRLVRVGPLPWLRSGPGRAADRRPKFDLRRLDPAYFRRLRARVAAAQRRGIYVSVMLFEGWGLQNAGAWRWRGDPFNPRNNVNGIDGDLDGDGTGTELQTLASPAVLRIQDAYVRKVVDTVNRFDNVLYEVANESGVYSTAWQYRVIRLVKRYEAGRKRHPVGMTFQHAGGSNANLFRSPADWVSPESDTYLTDPPVATGRKVVIADSDHICGLCADPAFPWKAFLRGDNVLFMDEFLSAPEHRGVRTALGQTRRYARRMDLRTARPLPSLCSTRYCLATPGRAYLAYQPGSGAFSVDLRAARGDLAVEWLNPVSGRTTPGGTVDGGAVRTLTPPFGGAAVLYLRTLRP
jgi:hypothetical protein